MTRALQGNSFTTSVTSYAGHTPADPSPDSATLGITRGDGSVLVAAGTGASEGGTGVFTYTLTGVQMATLDKLTASWLIGTSGNGKTVIDIVGGFMCQLSDLAVLYPNETDNELARRRTDIESRLEKACGVAFVPRYERERVTVRRRGAVFLKWGWIRRLTTVTVQGLALTSDQIAVLDIDWELGKIYNLPTSRLHGDVTIAYEHGADYADETARLATLSAMTETFGPNRVDGRVVSKSVDNVSVTYASGSGGSGGGVREFTSSDVVSFIRNNQRPLTR